LKPASQQRTAPTSYVEPSALILDFGEVLVRAQSRGSIERLASLAQLPVDDFLTRYWRHRQAYDAGLTGPAYWRRVLDRPDGTEERLIDELIHADAGSWMDYRDSMWDLTAAFRARGGRTAILSNGVHEIISHVRADRPLASWFDVVIVSCEVGCAKPDLSIYRLCLERLGVPAASALFVDDRLDNLHAAEQAGLRTFHFTGDDSVVALRNTLAL
jgi:putative hydrolase of the HAD superfamily